MSMDDRDPSGNEGFLERLSADTWSFLSAEQTRANQMPCSWWSEGASIGGRSVGAYVNPAEIGLYTLCWLAAHDLRRPWSPSWNETAKEIAAILRQLRAWRNDTGDYPQPHGPNTFRGSAFYQWYWLSETPPVVSALESDHLVPAIDNAWLAVSLLTIRAYARSREQSTVAREADALLKGIDFRLWYHPEIHRFFLGEVEDPQGGTIADYYSNENRIVNFVARVLGHLDASEFQSSLEALERPDGVYEEIAVANISWRGAYFTYLTPALFIREMETSYGAETITPVTRAQTAYARDQEYLAWGLSDCYDIEDRGYVWQGAPPVASPESPETRPGLVTPHASALALLTPLAPEATTNLQTMATTFPCAYHPQYGFRDALVVDPQSPDLGRCSVRFSLLAQIWIFLALVNHQTGFVWRYFYQNPQVARTHREMYGEG